MNKIDYLVVGQGIAGTMASFEILKRGLSCKLVNTNIENSASYVSAGIINPVTGRRIVKSWLIDELFPFALKSYSEMGKLLDNDFIKAPEIYKLISDFDEENTWLLKANEPNSHLKNVEDDKTFHQYFKDFNIVGKINPALIVKIKVLLKAWAQYLLKIDCLIQENISPNDLQFLDDEIVYKDLKFNNVILADGHNGISNFYFNNLPYRNAKGEVLHIKSETYNLQHIVHGTTHIIPEENDTYWVGSNYGWDFKDDLPSKTTHDLLKEKLEKMVKFDYEIIDHVAAIRPCSHDRKPYIGRHSQHKNLWLLNGFGTKGISLSPYMSAHLIDHIENGTPLMPDVDIKRIKS